MATQPVEIRKVAAIYDIHGNLPALEAVLGDIEGAQPDLILVGGDVATGPMPRETVDLLRSLGARARFVRGNADREVVTRHDHLDEGRERADGDVFERITDWTARQLTREQRDFLAAFPQSIVLQIRGLGEILFCHGSPRSDEEIITYATPEDRMRSMLVGVAQQVVVCGHTHSQFDRVVAGTHVINAGSVGMPYEGQPGAYWALLGPDVSLRRTSYDLQRAADSIRVCGMPGAEEFVRENVLEVPTAQEATELFERMAEERSPEGAT